MTTSLPRTRHGSLYRLAISAATVPQVIAANSGHYVHIDQPELVIKTVLEMVDRVRP